MSRSSKLKQLGNELHKGTKLQGFKWRVSNVNGMGCVCDFENLKEVDKYLSTCLFYRELFEW